MDTRQAGLRSLEADQRFLLRPPRRLFIALPHRRQMQILQMLDQRRAYVGHSTHCCTAVSAHNWSKLARSTAATSTTVTGVIVSSLRSSSPTDSAVTAASVFP